MTWFGTFLLIYWAANAVAYFALIGRQWRVTAEMAVGMLFVYGLLAWGAIAVGTVQP